MKKCLEFASLSLTLILVQKCDTIQSRNLHEYLSQFQHGYPSQITDHHTHLSVPSQDAPNERNTFPTMNRTKPIAMATSYFRSVLSSSNIGRVQAEGRKSVQYTTVALVKAESATSVSPQPAVVTTNRTRENEKPSIPSPSSSKEKFTWKSSSDRWKSDGILLHVAGDCQMTGF